MNRHAIGAALLLLAPFAAPGAGAEVSEGESGHVPPAAPAQPMPDMSYRAMAGLMGMDDTAAFGKLLIDQLELAAEAQRATVSWEAEGWYGTDDSKVWLKSEGAPAASGAPAARNELLWDRAISEWWSLQTGVRYDLGHGPARGWAAAGIEGLAPYRFELESALYLGNSGRTAALLRAEREVLITQRFILQPELETELYGKGDPARQLGAGVSDLQLGIRARYEIRRELAPYVGLAWRRAFGATANFARADGGDAATVEWVAGVHVWL